MSLTHRLSCATPAPQALPVLLLGATLDAEAAQRTIEALSRQSVVVDVLPIGTQVSTLSADFLALVLVGCEPDPTACERAAWFLAAHPDIACVSGATRGQAGGAQLANIAQFLVVRRQAGVEALADGAWDQPAAAIALSVGLSRRTGRPTGWIPDPVVAINAQASSLQALEGAGREALQSFGLTERDMGIAEQALPSAPMQRLAAPSRPPLTARVAPCTGLRVLALFQGFPMGGYTAFNADLLPRMAALGHCITTCATEWWRSDWRLDRVRAASPDVHHPASVVPLSEMHAYIDWLIESRAIEVVLLSHSFVGMHLLPYLRARHPRVAFVDYVHTDWFETGMYGSYATLAMQWESQLDAQLATSQALVAQLVAGGCDPAGVRAAHIGVDTTAWQPAASRRAEVRNALGVSPDTLVMIFAGRLSPEKRPLLAVDIAAELRDEGRDVVLLFAGNGPLLQTTVARVEQRSMQSRCKFFGEVDEATLQHLYAAADIFLAPSEIEGIARCLYEAMAMGCVPVVSDVGGQRELVVPGTGSLVPADGIDPSRYIEGIRPLLKETLRQQASAAARAHIVANFDSAATVQTVCATLRLAQQRRPSRSAMLPPAMAEQMAVLGLEVMRRHVLRPPTAPSQPSAPVAVPKTTPVVAPPTPIGASDRGPRSPGAKGDKPTVLVIADVPNWIFERHARTLQQRLGDEFDITVQYHTEAFDEAPWDLIYVMEYGLVPSERITMPWKYVTALRSHVSWNRMSAPELARYLGAHFQRTHVVSARLRDELLPWLPDVAYVTHGIDAARFHYHPRQQELGRPLRVGWAGNRQTAVKGFAEFIQPIGALRGVELVFCGYADRNRTLDEMPAWYADVDVYVCASLNEGNNNSLLEAAASGCAIITTDNGTVPEYLTDGVHALIVPRSRDAFTAAVARLRDDPALRVRLGKAASGAVLPAWTWDVKAEDHRQFFRQALAARGNARRAMVNTTPGGRRWMTAMTEQLEDAVQAFDAPAALLLLETLLDADPDNAGFREIRTLLTAPLEQCVA